MLLINVRSTAALTLLLLLVSCGHDSKVTDLQSRVITLQEEVKGLKQQMSLNDMFKDLESIAYLTPGTDGYALIKSDIGMLTVSLENIQPYANGSKVTLKFGNLTAATIDGLKAKLEWGSLDKKGMPNNQDAKSREIRFKESLPSGTWTNDNVVLEGIPPADLGFVRLREVGHTGVKLRR